MGDVFDNLVVDVLCKFYSTLCPAGGADPAALTWFDKLTTGENATRSEYLQPSQYTLAAPWARIPQFKYSARVLVTACGERVELRLVSSRTDAGIWLRP